MIDREYTVLFPFGGIGGGALGFKESLVELLGTRGRYRILGGIDCDSDACKDFVALNDAPSLCALVETLEPKDLHAAFGRSAPDVVFMSPPCVGSSGLLSEAKAKEPRYRALNGLALTWTRLMLRAWDEPPRVILFENVPRITTRARHMLGKLRAMLRRAGYILHDGHHDCGELGGLAQHRRRFLMVARHAKRVPPLLYQPPKRRVRGCGEVIGPMPMPGDAAAGPMHSLPKISWLNWVRLSLIPAGGHWRDLAGVLAEGEERRAKFKRHKVETWSEPVGTIGGSGSNGVENVADPRLPLPCSENPGAHHNKYRVESWEAPAHTVIGATRPGSGAPSVADPRPFGNVDRVRGWDAPAGTVTSSPAPSSGAGAVADPRPFGNVLSLKGFDEPAATVTSGTGPTNGGGAVADPRARAWFRGTLGIGKWEKPSGTITGNARASTGPFSVADPRSPLIPSSPPFDKAYGVLGWKDPSHTVAAGSDVGQGAYSVADLRIDCEPRSGAYGVLSWEEAAATITGHAKIDNGRFSIGDPRRPPSFTPFIRAADGTWHRPLTTLELAALQDLPTIVNGAPLVLAGSSHSEWRRRIGNCVPRGAARAIGERILVALVQADLGAFALSSGGAVWVDRGVHA